MSPAQLLWPIAVVIIVCLFRRDLSSILKRLKKGKVFGQELELESQITEFERVTLRAVDQVEVEGSNVSPHLRRDAATNADSPGDMIRDAPMFERAQKQLLEDEARISEIEDQVLEYAIKDPQLGVMKLGAVLEKEIRLVTKTLGTRHDAPLFEVLNDLRDRVPAEVLNSLTIFWDVRNKVTHSAADDDAAVRVLDIGLKLLRTFRKIRYLSMTPSHFAQSKQQKHG